MSSTSEFPGLLLTQTPDGVSARFVSLPMDSLPPGEVLVRVEYSSLNYKDALAVRRGAPVVRSFPMVPGIDLAGVVEQSDHADFRAGDPVLVNGWGLGETRWGGYARYCRVPGEYVHRIPPPLNAAQAMAIGTAGYTAMLCLMALQHQGVTPERGDVLVTGASGGVGSIAIPLLASQGFRVVASTGKADEHAYLRSLGAAEIIDRALLSSPGKPLQTERWGAAIDSVGSHTLANVCASLRYGGVVAACGLAQGMDFPATVAPFILRGVTLRGIDSVRAPRAAREQAWARLAQELDLQTLGTTSREIELPHVIEAAEHLLAGRSRGRAVVRIPDR